MNDVNKNRSVIPKQRVTVLTVRSRWKAIVSVLQGSSAESLIPFDNFILFTYNYLPFSFLTIDFSHRNKLLVPSFVVAAETLSLCVYNCVLNNQSNYVLAEYVHKVHGLEKTFCKHHLIIISLLAHMV